MSSLQKTLAEPAPTAVDRVPAGQLEHAAAPEPEYLPATQSEHTVAVVTLEYWPAAQLIHAVAPVPAEYVPAGHAPHAVRSPAALAYVPAAHAAHGPNW